MSTKKTRFDDWIPPIKCRKEEKDQLDEAAGALNISMSEYVRRATRIALRAGLQELEYISHKPQTELPVRAIGGE